MFHFKQHIEDRFRSVTIFAAMPRTFCHRRIIWIHDRNSLGALARPVGALCGFKNFVTAVYRRLPFCIDQRFEFLALFLSRLLPRSVGSVKAFHQLLKPRLLYAGKKGIGPEVLHNDDGSIAVFVARCDHSFDGIQGSAWRSSNRLPVTAARAIDVAPGACLFLNNFDGAHE